ncbi:MAG: serine/threonine protein kinase [Nannocystaceae bacterium]|nr:serine/threonine protein kinase [Nannocystaceae bacterium]
MIPRSVTESARELDEATELAAGVEVFQEKVYEIVDRIGEGGMGKVYRAYEANMDRYVALKVLKLDVPEPLRRRFRREAVIAANFSHPNLPRVLDVGTAPDTQLQWMTMEYLRGRDLGEIIDSGTKVAFPLLVDMVDQTLNALDYIHTRRIAHCDVKPDNIFVTRDPYNRRIVTIKLIDFGIFRHMDPEQEVQREISGDPRYMAPELTVLNGPVDGRTDLYSLGITMYECLTGAHPFEEWLDVDANELLRMHCEVEPPMPSTRLDPAMRPRLAQAIDSVFAQACAKDPIDRFANALEMKKAVAGLLDVT